MEWLALGSPAPSRPHETQKEGGGTQTDPDEDVSSSGSFPVGQPLQQSVLQFGAGSELARSLKPRG